MIDCLCFLMHPKEMLEIIQVPDIIEISQGQMMFVFDSSANYCGRTEKGFWIVCKSYSLSEISQL